MIGKTRDGAATQIIAVGKTARQDNSIEAASEVVLCQTYSALSHPAH